MNPAQLIFFFLFFLGITSVLTFMAIGLYGAVFNTLFIRYMRKKNPKRYDEIWMYYKQGPYMNVAKWYFKEWVPYMFNSKDCKDKKILYYKKKLRFVLKSWLYLGITFGVSFLLVLGMALLFPKSFS